MHRRFTGFTYKAIVCAALLSAGCNRHDPVRAERAVRQIKTDLRQGQLDRALTSARSEANRWVDRSGSNTYVTFRLLETEALLNKGQAPVAHNVLTHLDIPSREPRLEAQRQIILGRSLIGLRKYDQAKQALNLASDLADRQGNDDLRLEVRIAKGLLLTTSGKLDEAEGVFRSALNLADKLDDSSQRMTIALNIGYIRLFRSQYDRAIPYFEKARVAGQSAGQQQPVSIAIQNLAICHYQLGDFDQAFKLIRQAIAIQQNIKAGNLSYSYGELGNMLLLQGEVLRAVPNYERAIQLSESMRSDPGVLLWANNLAHACIELRDWNRADQLNRRAEDIAERIGDKESKPYLQLNSAAIAAGRGNRDHAIRLYDRVATGSGTVPPAVIWEANAALANLYAAEGNRDQARQHFESALYAIEQARSEVSASDYKITFLSQLIRFYQDYVDLLIDEGDDRKALAVAESSRARILAERLDADKAAAADTKLRDLQGVARSARAVLLSYWIAPKRSVVWVITSAGTHVVVLPADKAAIEKLVTTYDAEVQRGIRDPLTSGSAAGNSLYEVLVRPIEALIPTGASVIVVPDGPLHNLNLETLPVPGAHPHYWIEQVTLSVAPSLSLLAQARAKSELRGAGVLLVGNPKPVDQYPRLPNAEREIDDLRRLFSSKLTIVQMNLDATPAAYKQIDPQRFALIHFAAHAEANRERPLDSAVILWNKDDEYKLYARDVLDSHLRAELVTVSACESAGAKAYAGEGLVGFAWAFLHAGAKNVVAGLWKVDDSSTAKLMSKMYAGIAAGAAPDKALHDAKLTLIHSSGNEHKPFYWGPFQVYRRSAQ